MGLFRKKKENIKPYTTAVIPAAGISARMNGSDKLLMDLNGMPVIAHTLIAFENCDEIDEIIICANNNNLISISEICSQYEISKASKVISGGTSRIKSVYKGVFETPPYAEFIAIHDAARPLITPGLISDTLKCAYEFNASAPVIPLKDTIKEVKNGYILKTIDRESIKAVQTPQVFNADIIKAALTKAINLSIEYTDECASVEALGINIKTIPGSYENLKITSAEDLITAEVILSNREETI